MDGPGFGDKISVLFCSRVKDNPDSNVRRLLDSAVEYIRPDERDKVEFLIKYDDDDDARPPDSFFARYPFTIRTFTWGRGEGRHSLHNVQDYLFAPRDPRSRSTSRCLVCVRPECGPRKEASPTRLWLSPIAPACAGWLPMKACLAARSDTLWSVMAPDI